MKDYSLAPDCNGLKDNAGYEKNRKSGSGPIEIREHRMYVPSRRVAVGFDDISEIKYFEPLVEERPSSSDDNKTLLSGAGLFVYEDKLGRLNFYWHEKGCFTLLRKLSGAVFRIVHNRTSNQQFVTTSSHRSRYGTISHGYYTFDISYLIEIDSPETGLVYEAFSAGRVFRVLSGDYRQMKVVESYKNDYSRFFCELKGTDGRNRFMLCENSAFSPVATDHPDAVLVSAHLVEDGVYLKYERQNDAYFSLFDIPRGSCSQITQPYRFIRHALMPETRYRSNSNSFALPFPFYGKKDALVWFSKDSGRPIENRLLLHSADGTIYRIEEGEEDVLEKV